MTIASTATATAESGRAWGLRPLRAGLAAAGVALQLVAFAACWAVVEIGQRAQFLALAALLLPVCALAMVLAVRRLTRNIGGGDIAPLKLAEQALRESEQRFALVAAGSNDGIWDWDFARDRHYISPRLKAMLGYADAELPSRREAYRQCIHADDRERAVAGVERCFREGGEYEDEYRLCRRDGSHIWVRSRGAAVRATDGSVARFCGSVSEISTQREASERVNALLDEQRAMLDNLVAGMARLKDRRIATCNRRFAEMYGYTVEELIGQPAALLHPDRAHDEAGDAVYADLARDGKVGREFLHRRRDGSLIWVYSSGTALDRDDPRKDSLWIDVDINEQKRAEQALRENEARFYHAVRGSRDAIWDWDLANDRYYMSPRMKEILGYGFGEPIRDRKWYLERLHEDDRARVNAARLAHFENGEPYEVDYRMRAADGTFRWIRARGESVRDANGRVVRYSGANSDITAEREASERIRALLAEERAILDNALVGIARLKHRVIATCNQRFAEMFGYAPDELLGRSVTMLYGSEAEAAEGAKCYEQLRADGHFRGEQLHADRAGRRFWCEEVGAALDAADPAADSLWVVLDIDSRKRAEDALRRSEESYRAFVSNADEVIWRFEYRDPVPTHLPVGEQVECIVAGGYLAECNKRLAQVYGYESEQAPVGLSVEAFGGREANLALSGAFVRGGYRLGSYEWNEAVQGETRWFLGSMVGVIEDGCLVRTWGTQTDITDRKRTEQALRASEEDIRALNQQLEERVAERTAELTRANRELESFSYTVSHDLSAPLRAINGFSALLVEELAGKLDASAQRLLERIAAGSMQMKALIDDLLRLAQISRTPLVAREVDLAELARQVAAQCTQDQAQDPARAPAGRRVEFRAPAALPAHGDAGLLGIALTNLIGNAWKFTARSDPAQVEFGAIQQAGERVYFLRDNGAGLDMRYAAKLFKPFQRLHSAQEFAGTGIGLAIVHRIVERHRGRIWVASAPDTGTTFYFTLGPTTISSSAHVS